jgi:hypothetical protein
MIRRAVFTREVAWAFELDDGVGIATSGGANKLLHTRRSRGKFLGRPRSCGLRAGLDALSAPQKGATTPHSSCVRACRGAARSSSLPLGVPLAR